MNNIEKHCIDPSNGTTTCPECDKKISNVEYIRYGGMCIGCWNKHDLIRRAKQTKRDTMNIDKYLENTINTENGTIYRKEDWENADPDEIIYICEFRLNELGKMIEEGKNPTDDELIEQNIASSKNSIRAEIKQYFPKATDEWIDKHDLIADIMRFVSWEHTETVVVQMDEWDIWDDYPEK